MPVAIPTVNRVSPIAAALVAISFTVVSEGSRWYIALNVFSLSSRSCNKYMMLARKTTKNAAYANRSRVV